MREEERLAKEFYAAIAAEYDGARPLSQITRAENNHYEAIGTLLERYDIADPGADLKVGDYAFDELDDLYKKLFAQFQESREQTLAAGVLVEETDIAALARAVNHPHCNGSADVGGAESVSDEVGHHLREALGISVGYRRGRWRLER